MPQLPWSVSAHKNKTAHISKAWTYFAAISELIKCKERKNCKQYIGIYLKNQAKEWSNFVVIIQVEVF